MDPIFEALSAEPLAQAWPRPSPPLPVVGIGAGGIVRSAHLPAYARLGAPVLGLYDPRTAVAEKLAADFGVGAVYKDLGEAILAGQQAGAVFDIAVPAEAVREILEQLPSGSNVLIQKPFGRDLEEARVLLSLCEEKSLRAAVNFQLRFSPNVLALRDALRRRLLGQVIDVEVRVNVHTPWHLWSFLRGIPRHEILYHSVHYLDLLRYLLGEPRGVLCRVCKDPALVDYSDTSSATLLDYGPELRCLVSTFHAHEYPEGHEMSSLKVEGTLGAAILKMGVNLDYPKGRPDTLSFASKGGSSWHDVPLRGGWFDYAFEGPLNNLSRTVCGDDAELVSGARDAARTMALVEACYQSSQSASFPVPEV